MDQAELLAMEGCMVSAMTDSLQGSVEVQGMLTHIEKEGLLDCFAVVTPDERWIDIYPETVQLLPENSGQNETTSFDKEEMETLQEAFSSFVPIWQVPVFAQHIVSRLGVNKANTFIQKLFRDNSEGTQ